MLKNGNERCGHSSACCSSCKKDLKRLRAIDFAIQETVLYLDAYPECRQALEYYHKLIEVRERLLSSYEKSCVRIFFFLHRPCWVW